MKLRKVLCLILALTCVLGTLCIGAGAEVNATGVVETVEYEIVESFFDSYLFYAECLSGYFAEGNAPSMSTIYFILFSDVLNECEDYCVIPEDMYNFATYEIPEKIYEDMAARYFVKNEALIDTMRESSYYKTDKAEPYYYITVGGGLGDRLPSFELCGLATRNYDGCISVYGYLVEDWDDNSSDMIYSPDDDDVEGVDYVILGRNYYDYSTGDYVFSYKPWKLVGAVRSVISLNDSSGDVVLHSFEQINVSDIPSDEVLEVRAPEESVVSSFGGVAVIEKDTFAENTIIGGGYISDDESDGEFATAKTALAEYALLGDLYEITASNGDGTDVEPNKPFTVCFDIPFGFCEDVKIYRIAEDNAVTELSTEFVSEYRFVCAEIDTLGKYAVAGSLYGDANGDNDITLSDVTLMLKDAAGWNMDMNVKACDVNADGVVTLADVTLMLKYLAGWDVYFGVQTY